MNFNKLFTLYICAMLFTSVVFGGYDINMLRKDFFTINEDLTKAQNVYEQGLKEENKSVVYLGYLGALQAMLAANQSNPFSKLSWFNKGKAVMEKAIEKLPDNPELRFLRLSIQLKAPSFLFYYNDIDEDKKIVIDNIASFNNLNIIKYVKLFLIENASLSPEEKEKLNG